MTDLNQTPAPETKMGSGAEIVEAFDDFMHAFESFKDANDDRLQQLETRMTSDVVTEDKVNRINKAVDEQKRHLDTLILKNRRPAFGRQRRWLANCSTEFCRQSLGKFRGRYRVGSSLDCGASRFNFG